MAVPIFESRTAIPFNFQDVHGCHQRVTRKKLLTSNVYVWKGLCNVSMSTGQSNASSSLKLSRFLLRGGVKCMPQRPNTFKTVCFGHWFCACAVTPISPRFLSVAGRQGNLALGLVVDLTHTVKRCSRGWCLNYAIDMRTIKLHVFRDLGKFGFLLESNPRTNLKKAR